MMANFQTSQISSLWKSIVRRLPAVFLLAAALAAFLLAGGSSARAQTPQNMLAPLHSEAGLSPLNDPLDWGTIDISTDDNSELVVTLENSEIRVVYQQSSNDWAIDHNGRPSCIDEFFVKSLNKDITDGGRFDNQLHQKSMTAAQVIYDGPDKKTVHMTWESGAEQEVSLFPDSNILQIDYIRWDFLITDWPDWPNDNNPWQEQMIEVYGAELWHRTIDPADQPTRPDGWSWDPNDPTHFPNDPDAMREWGLGYDEIYYDWIASDLSKQGELDPEDAGPLNYNGHFVLGAHKLASGEGYGRTLPVDRTRAIILWGYRGWEFVPTGSGQFTSYLYPITNGKQQILALGKQLADDGKPPMAVDDTYAVDEAGTLSVVAAAGVLFNDIDQDSDPLTAALLIDVSQGTLTFNPDGSFVYTHDGSETTSDSFTYEVDDGRGGTNSAAVNITINPINDPPTAVNNIYAFQKGYTLTVPAAGVLSNDTDPEGSDLTAALLSDVNHGDLALNSDGSFIYTHDGSDSSSDSFTYEADDGNGGVDTATVTLDTNALQFPNGLLALYSFIEGDGDTVHDVSGVGAPLDLTIQDPANTTWIPGGGLAINADTVVNSDGPAAKIVNGAKATNELTIEAWVDPANTTQFGPARIVALTHDAYPSGGNFILGQGPGDGDVSYDARLRTTTTNAYGTPSLTSPNGSLTLNLTHVVFTRDATGATTLYLDGSPVANGSAAGDFSNWGSYALGLANEADPALGSRPWLGELHLVAIYDNALDQNQVLQNYYVGPIRNLAPPVEIVNQIIPLASGWNTISSYVTPPDEDGDIFLADYAAIRLCKDDSGHVYFPELGINTISSWNVNKGYRCFATSNISLSITGPKVPDGAALTLPSGWSIIPYWSNTGMPIETGLAGIVNDLGLVKDNQGNVYWPLYEVNTIGDMEPGQGYQIYLDQPAELIYPSD